jgi:long-chain acyl-CoA synthetase
MTNDNKKLCPSIKKIVSSSAPLDIDTRNKCLNHFACEIFETYGLSETGFVTLKKLKKDNEQNNSIGKPLPFVSVKLFDAHKNNFTHETNTTGEIAVKCSSIFDGYGNDLNEHPKYIFKDYFLTGDLAYLDEKGELTFVGRTQEVIQNSGINVYPLDVEKMVKQYPSVKDACVFGVPEGGSSEKIVLLYSTSFEIDENDLIRFLLKNLTDWQMPKYFRRVSEIDLSPVGKVDRKNMRDKFLRKTLGVM